LLPNEDSRNRIVAVGMLFERAWGKPKEYDPAAEKPEDKGTFNPRDFSPQGRPQAEILPPERRLHRRA
jgi:hypothetical protein